MLRIYDESNCGCYSPLEKKLKSKLNLKQHRHVEIYNDYNYIS